jgi:two-component system, NtrC family, response regulator AtoC
MTSPHILLVADEPATIQSVTAVLAGNSYDAEAVPFGAPALWKIYGGTEPSLVLLELDSRQGESFDTLQRFLHMRPDLKVIVLSKTSDSRPVVEAIRIGARDYISFPYQEIELLEVLKRHLGADHDTANFGMKRAEDVGGGHVFVSASPMMKKVRLEAELLSNIDAPVLLSGESGTGKEVIAYLIHKLSARSHRRLLKINCAALPDELLESELFGHERGAFSGAIRTKAGLFELCDKGTILLDEVAEMSSRLQAKLLHVLQDKQFFRLGGETTIEVDVRVLAATNVDIQQAISERRLREDLYYRLSAFTIFLPPLRERREEIPLLLEHFMERLATQYSKVSLPLPARLKDACLRYAWPGNLRELQNFVKRYLVMADEETAFADLRDGHNLESTLKIARHSKRSLPTTEDRARDLKFLVRNSKDETEVEAITKALGETKWNRKKAARLLHISYRTLLYKIQQHSITADEPDHTLAC